MDGQMGLFPADGRSVMDVPWQEEIKGEWFCWRCGVIHPPQFKQNLMRAVVQGTILLVNLWERLDEKRPINTKEFCRGSDEAFSIYSNFSKAKHFKLAIPAPTDDPSKIHSGYYTPSQHGIDFVHGRIRVYDHIIMVKHIGMKFRGFYAWSGEKATKEEALKKPWDYIGYCKDNGIPTSGPYVGPVQWRI